MYHVQLAQAVCGLPLLAYLLVHPGYGMFDRCWLGLFDTYASIVTVRIQVRVLSGPKLISVHT